MRNSGVLASNLRILILGVVVMAFIPFVLCLYCTLSYSTVLAFDSARTDHAF
jgi:hypothetical protein